MLRRFSVFSLVFLLCLSLFPARAFASYFSDSASVLWSGSVNGGAQYGAFVKGGTNYDAAVAALGYDSSRLSDEVKTRLADESYSGYFYTFATSFQRVSTPFDIPSWVPAFVTTGSVIADLWNNISGSSYPHWSVEVVSVLYDLALRDFKAVLAGEDLGGGGGSGGEFNGTFLEVSSIPCDSTSRDEVIPPNVHVERATVATFIDGSLSVGSGGAYFTCWLNSRYHVSSMTLFVSEYVQGLANNYLSQGFDVSYFYNHGSCGFIIGHDLQVISYTSTDSSGYVMTRNGLQSSSQLMSFSLSVNSRYWDVSDGLPFVVFPTSGTPSQSVHSSPTTWSYVSAPITSPVIPPPSGTWPEPDTPVTPTAPELPEPASPTVETPVSPTVPAPVWPDITINIDNDPTPGTTPSGLDYTELLTRINDNLISIDSFVRAINSNLNSLRSDLLAEFNGVIDSLRNIYNYLLTIDSVLETHCTHLRNKIEQSAVFIANYMRTLIKWLADQLDFDDLTNVEAPDNSLLTTINEKLGGGTYEPNPIKDENAYYEWLDDLWDRFLLGDNWQSSMGSISGSFSELKTRFPFSVPWDIVSLFRLFVHDPVTPVFDLPLYFSADGSTPIHVDLSPWDSVASLVRPMIFVIFALKLALLSRELLGGLGADKGGL